MKACCVFSLESPHRGDSIEYTQHAIINMKKKITLNHPKCNNVCSYGIFPRDPRQVQNSHGKRALGVRAIEVLLYVETHTPSGGYKFASTNILFCICKTIMKAGALIMMKQYV